jgi:allantoicase
MTNSPSFTTLTDLAAERFGGLALACSDDFFAEKENLLKPGRGIFIPDKYTERGKWMDGWESRRKRTEGHDWCIVRLGAAGTIHGVDIDTNHFLGNHPPYASLEACRLDEHRNWNLESEANVRWTEILPKSPLQPGSQNLFAVANGGPWTHVKLHIYPDGGVARLKVYGEVARDWSAVDADELVDLAAAVNGGRAVACNDEFFSHKENINMPGRGVNMGDGWETKRNRTPGNRDWLVLRLARRGTLRRIVVDTAHFKGNYPDRCLLEGCVLPPDTESFAGADWKLLLPEQKLQPDAEHVFEGEIKAHAPVTHVRLTIVPDGGVSRLRLFGTVDRDAVTLAELNAMPENVFREKLAKCCGARAWVDRMLAARPFRSQPELLEDASRAWFSCRKADWLEGFTHHPRIGDVDSLRQKFASTAAWAGHEQGAVRQAGDVVLEELKDWNDRYFEKFGFIFIVFATGKSAEEMLAILKRRYENEEVEEIVNAVLEQDKITRLRLTKLIL